ncbi:copper resistance CopC/CopD family protein [Streptacidiphilus carbonis]|uniref:copper resistance CopC/CopD family protein n=1 Tax=Streptacidiphilus carbonis TaxID=105422 RepID=UPI001F2EBE95|nr:CopD family protein [Streptacidiphilus carbonis]
MATFALSVSFALVAPGASAHAELLRSTPADGARLTALPEQITLVFSEAVDGASSSVVIGSRRLVARVRPGDARVLVADTGNAPESANGTGWTLDWRAVSQDDGHVTTGQLHYTGTSTTATVGRAAVAALPVAAMPAPDPTVKHLLTGARLIGYLALALFVGGLAFLALLWPQGSGDRRTRAVLAAAWFAGLTTTVATVGLQGAYAAMRPPGALFSARTYADVLATHLGVVLTARALLWLLAGVVLTALLQGGERAARSPGWRIGGTAVAFGLLRTTGMAGHTAEVAQPVWGAVADTVHLIGVSLWIGGLTLLLVGVLPRRRPEELAFVVPRYSTLALTAVTGIVAAGLVLAWQLVGSVDALVHTSYGHLLLVKVALLLVVLLLAQRSKAWVRHRLDIAVLLRGDSAAVRPFVYSVAAETGVVLLVLTATSLLVTSDPGH